VWRRLPGARRRSIKQASGSFLKKRTKKLLFAVGVCPVCATTHCKYEFFVSFFAKKEVLYAVFEWAHRGAVKQIPAFAIITDWDILFVKMC
jgi:hypothetical protein